MLTAGCTVFISFFSASLQKVVPVSSSILSARLTVFGNSSPNFSFFLRYRVDLVALMIRSHFLSVYGTHQAKAGSCTSLFTTAYSATWTGCEFRRSFSASQLVDPSFQCRQSCHPLVVFLGHHLPCLLTKNPSSGLTASAVSR